jgi:hypothetical protein
MVNDDLVLKVRGLQSAKHLTPEHNMHSAIRSLHMLRLGALYCSTCTGQEIPWDRVLALCLAEGS